jgi:hypothetical protein
MGSITELECSLDQSPVLYLFHKSAIACSRLLREDMLVVAAEMPYAAAS